MSDVAVASSRPEHSSAVERTPASACTCIHVLQFVFGEQLAGVFVSQLVGALAALQYMQTCLLMLTTSARSPNFISYKRRRSSLDGISDMPASSKPSIASSGFFHTDGQLRCFFCNISVHLHVRAAELDDLHSRNSVKCFVTKLKNNIRLKNFQEEIQRSKKAWGAVLPYLRNPTLVDFTSSFGFNKIIVRIGIVRYFVFSNGHFPRSGDVIELIHRDLAVYDDDLLQESLLDNFDPLSIVVDFMQAKPTDLQDQRNLLETPVAGKRRDASQASTSVPQLDVAAASTHKSYCTHSQEQKDVTSKALVMIPCLHLIRCAACLVSESLQRGFRCPRCDSATQGGILAFIT